MATDPLVLVWLVILTIGNLATLVGIVALNQRLRQLPSTRELDLNEKMDRVLQVASSQVVMKNEAIRRQARTLIDCIEADPMAAEKFFTQVLTLKQALEA